MISHLVQSACLIGASLLSGWSVLTADDIVVSPIMIDDAGVHRTTIQSPYQAGKVALRILPPQPYDSDKTYPAIYLLPVEKQGDHQYGDPIDEILKHKRHQKHAAFFVAPDFAQLPWYADHPTDPLIQQEKYFLEVVLPTVEENYPVIKQAEGRLLCGFSKSGWGAWSLLLRHPETFERAVAWDAPLMMEQQGKYGNGPIFGTEENFKQYRLTSLLSEQQVQLKQHARLISLGYGNFRNEHIAMHAYLQKLEIPHIDRDGPQRKHDWHSGWVAEAVELLLTEKLDLADDTP